MPETPFPLNITPKENSPQLLAYLQQFGDTHYLSAEDINKITTALEWLHLNSGDGSSSGSIVPFGNYFLFKADGNIDPDLEVEDIIQGFWAGENYDDGEGTIITTGRFIMAKYNGGTNTDFSNYTLLTAF